MSKNFQISNSKGLYGEMLVAQELGQRGILTTKWDQIGSHPFDKIMVDKNTMKIIALFDVKTKPLRNYYKDTGIDLNKFHQYLDASKENKLPFAIFFVDEVERAIYWAFLSELYKERMFDGQKYPKKESFAESIIYFHRLSLRTLCHISENAALQIRQNNQRGYAYPDDLTATFSSIAASASRATEEWIAERQKEWVYPCP